MALIRPLGWGYLRPYQAWACPSRFPIVPGPYRAPDLAAGPRRVDLMQVPCPCAPNRLFPRLATRDRFAGSEPS